ncbi:guanine nucleotide exchange factor DBS-like isoform X2 [Hippocampus comes]|uniref:guanine nucleotide exchange factor DBS-like isoform X2 n=1 Tax=Hippocampus comes TaxID=109280 RepID=UPI00094EC4F2|nr:PREDICTED: guanine nucleotide exchange factor DBS-like isoform X2 [Hippocampus comes]
MAESEPQRGFPRLRRAATSFPGNLHLVLVLHPSALLSSAPSPSSSTDLGFRFSQDDFLLKMPVLMLGDLLRYIDNNRPTSDACGGAPSDWIVLRSAIETFAVTVKEVAHLLQAFGSELSDGELPDEADAVDFLLRSHTQRYRRMKDDVAGVLKEGRLLLDNLQTLQTSKKDAAEDQDDVQSDLDTVQRLLSQLRDMEEAFDGFFEKHHLKVQQYQQLLLYERNFQQMEEELEKMSGEEKAIPAAGNTLPHTEQLIGELGALEQRAQEVTSRAQVLTLRGHQLAARHHYALALIMQRCNELRHRCDVISGGLRGKRASLTRARDLLERLDRALRWCDEGAYLLASQMVDRFQSREGAQEALRCLLEHQERAPESKGDVLSLELEAILTPQLQGQIAAATDKLASMRAMIRNREGCLRKMADARVRPVQPVAPRPEAEPARPHGAKAPLFSPKHGVDFNLLNSRFSFDLLPGKRSPRRTGDQPEIHVMHDYRGNRSSLYGPAPDSDSGAEEGAEQVTSRIMKELISTEKLYVEQLLAVLLGYRAEMEDPSARDLLPALLRGHEDVLFGNMPQIYQFHSRTFLRDLQGCLDTPERVGQCFLQWKEKFQLYEHYCQNKPHSESLWNQCSDSAFFQECQRKLEHKLSLDSYLLKPIQRLAKYQLILKELLKHCDEPRYRAQLQEALDCMLDLLKSVNDSMHQIAIVGYQMSSVSLAENVKGDAKKFELCHRETQEVYVLQAPSVEVKAAWLAEIQKIIGRPRQDSSPAHPTGWEESANTGDPAARPSPSAAPSSDIGDGPEDWGAADASNVSDSDDAGEGERPASLEAGRYRILAAGCSASGDGIAFARGDVIRPLRRDDDGKWLVRNESRDQEGRVPPSDLHRILGETR